MSRYCADLTLGLKAQSTAVLHMLASYEVDFLSDPKLCNIKTAAWYNGRERGYSCLVQMYPGMGTKTLIIAWSEARSSDALLVYSWESDKYFDNPPTADDVPEEVWCEGAKGFPYGDAGAAAHSIYEAMEKFCKAQLKKAA
jgi:hypothetical protein